MNGRSVSTVRSPPSPDAALQVTGLTKRYGESVAVDAFSLAVARGQLVALLGPSGCGKTTTLRMIAGLVEPTAGSIVLEGRPVEGVPIHRRNIGMVFQQYALFPFLSVFENVAYGLRERRVAKEEARERVTKMLDLVGLTGLGERRIRQLSGGQQQRVALARALVINPALLLLDEPLSNLDTKLRERVRGEIRDLQRRLDITTVFVTHDQDEALSIAHVVVVMRGGHIEQVGTPLEIYQRPANAFVADFIGACNLVPSEVLRAADGIAHCRMGETQVRVATASLRAGDRTTLAARPERLHVGAGESSSPSLRGRVVNATYLGARTSYEIEAAGTVLRCDVHGGMAPMATGTSVSIGWEEGAWQALD